MVTVKKGKKFATDLKHGYHRHHVVPIHAGGKVHPWNEIYLLPNEHADAHYLRWIETGDKWDRVAYFALSGFKEGTFELLSECGKRGAEARAKLRKEGKIIDRLSYDRELASILGKKGGLKGGPASLKKAIANNQNHQSKAGKAGAKKQLLARAKCDTCGFVCRPANMWRHHKAHSHEGSTRVA